MCGGDEEGNIIRRGNVPEAVTEHNSEPVLNRLLLN